MSNTYQLPAFAFSQRLSVIVRSEWTENTGESPRGRGGAIPLGAHRAYERGRYGSREPWSSQFTNCDRRSEPGELRCEIAGEIACDRPSEPGELRAELRPDVLFAPAASTSADHAARACALGLRMQGVMQGIAILGRAVTTGLRMQGVMQGVLQGVRLGGRLERAPSRAPSSK